MTRLVLVIACALIDAAGRVLLSRRPEGKAMAGLWEFPGGKCEPFETPEACLVRELREELDITVQPGGLAPLSFASHAYGPEGGDFHLLMPLYVCREWRGECRPMEGQALQWARPEHLSSYRMPPADAPLIAHLLGLTKS